MQTITSPYTISMFAWSPRGARLAYTTSGFPDPHELYVLDRPGARPRRIFESRPHFDWVTWSPDGRLLLLDADKARGWRLFSAEDGSQVGVFRRLGGRPLWCCPVNAFSALAG